MVNLPPCLITTYYIYDKPTVLFNKQFFDLYYTYQFI